MKAKKTPAPRRAGTEDVEIAVEIDAIRKVDPVRYARIMRKLAEIEARRRK